MGHRVADAPNRAYHAARALWDEVVRSGVEHAIVCPGARSAPLAAAAVTTPGLRTWAQIDERAAGFFGLGLAKASARPVALVCTSGTAAAHFFPAVIEAHYARVPLLVLTADRPPELREWGAGQTIDQHGMYGGHVRWFAEPALPEATPRALRSVRELACRAVAAAAGRPPGPVHLNLPFREPLEPLSVPADRIDGDAADRPGVAGRDGAPYTRVAQPAPIPDPELVSELGELVAGTPRGVIVCGPMDASPELCDSVAALARAAGWPLLAEPTSQLRCGAHVAGAPVVASADLFLRDERFAAQHAPDAVLLLGGTPTSKALRFWLERHEPREVVLLDPDGGWNDPGHLASRVLRVDPDVLCSRLARRAHRAGSEWLDAFLAAEASALAAVEPLLADEALLEARAVRELAAVLPDDALLYVSNSMPVRDLDAFLPASARRLRVLSNRGANGIDGLVSASLGAAAAGRGPVTLLSGDLAFVHDVSGLVAARRHGLRATIVVLDNGGGGIFSFLPLAQHGASVGFEEHFRTPHGLDLVPLAEAFGARATRVGSWEHFRTAVKDANAGDATSVIVVPVDRDRNVEQHRAIASAVCDRLNTGPGAG